MSAVASRITRQPDRPAGSTLARLGAVARPWLRWMTLIGLLVLVSAWLELWPPLLMREIIDDHLTPARPDGLLLLALLYLGASTAVQAASAVAVYLTANVAQGALHDLRMRLFIHLEELPIEYYDCTPLGDVISRCTADVEAVDTLFSTGVANVAADLVRLVVVGVAMVALSPPLALVSTLVVPPLVAVTRLLQVRIRDAERANRLAVGQLNTHLQETLGGVEVIRAFGREESFAQRFRGALAATLAAYNRATVYAAVSMPAMATLPALATAMLLWAGTGSVFAGWGVSLGTLTAFVLLFQRFFKPITTLGDEWQTVQGALAGAERIFQVLALPTSEKPRDGEIERSRDGATETVGRVRGADSPAILSVAPSHRLSVPAEAPIALESVTFGYRADHPVLLELSLTVRPGEHVALVGRTGAGKSSALHLLGGLYTPWTGSVMVAGRDPTSLDEHERRRLLGVVPQVVQLFGGTVAENLTLYDPSVERSAVERATRIAGAEAFIRALPRGLDTPLSGSGRGEGAQLSAGQLQLLALARALVWSPPVLLLDEATAAVDGASDAAFRAALRAGARERGWAVLSVAHRLATAREADRVLVLEAGRLVEQGAPDELLRAGGRFTALAELEAAGWDWRASLETSS